MATALMNFGAFCCLHYISVLYVFFKLEANTLISPFCQTQCPLPRPSDVFLYR